MAKISELEGAVLGTVWAQQPCTAYAIRREFQRSPSPHWSGSAGAIYPLVERLVERRLLRSENHTTGRRLSRLIRVTPTGLRALRQWLSPPHEEFVIGVPPDSLRTRLQFLGALDPTTRCEFIEDARVRLAEHIQTAEKECRETRDGADPFPHLVSRGALGVLRARRKWLDEVARALD